METKVISNSAPSTKSELSLTSRLSTFYSCKTKGVVNEINFKWTIERSAFFGDFGIWETLKSPEFSDCKYFLTLDMTSFGSDVSICLHRDSNSAQYPLRVEIAVFNEKSEEIFKQSTNAIRKGVAVGSILCFKKKYLLEYKDFVNGNITISCKIESLTRKQLTGKAREMEIHLHKTPIRDDDKDLILRQLEESFEKMAFSDVTFIIRDQKFSAHKNILAMRSPVFAAMFQYRTYKEVLCGQVEVEDVDPDVFQEVLRYMYTGLPQSTALDVMAPALLAAADKYLLVELKSRCETHLIRQMSSQNCADLLSLTTHHPAEHLKKFAIHYFRRYPSEVMATDNWEKMKEENPALLCDLWQQMVLTAQQSV